MEGCTLLVQEWSVLLDSERQICTGVNYIKNEELNKAKAQLCYVKLGVKGQLAKTACQACSLDSECESSALYGQY